ncbi:MAG: hypothetical protein RIS47_1173 [Bacteroidota bacterium]
MKKKLLLLACVVASLTSFGQGIDLKLLASKAKLQFCLNDKIVFDVQGSYTADASVLNPLTSHFVWKVAGQVLAADAATVDFTFIENGEFVVSCDVTDLNGKTASLSQTVAVSVGPKITVSSSQPTLCQTENITLNAALVAGVVGTHTHTYDQNMAFWAGNAVPANHTASVTFSPFKDKGDQVYFYNVTDDYGCAYSATLEIPGVVADFTVSPISGEAPLLVSFTNMTTGGNTYTWTLTNKDTQGVLSITGDAALKNVVTETLYDPGKYTVLLFAKNNLCTHTKSMGIEDLNVIDVLFSNIISPLPNVFTPNGDGVNDVFNIVPPVSMKQYKITIMNRWGNKVHEYDVNNMTNPQSDWQNNESGWDGKINGTYASSGTYFYIINALGYDAKTYAFKGSLFLKSE